jgi:hypothetical protein
MNEALDDLIYHSGLIADGCWEDLDTYTQEAIERLFHLTVQECVRACINEGKTYEIESAGEHSSNFYATAIKKHLGVEE